MLMASWGHRDIYYVALLYKMMRLELGTTSKPVCLSIFEQSLSRGLTYSGLAGGSISSNLHNVTLLTPRTLLLPHFSTTHFKTLYLASSLSLETSTLSHQRTLNRHEHQPR